MFKSLEASTNKSNKIELTLAVKQHILANEGKSISEIRYNCPFEGSYLAVSQIKEVFDLARKVENFMDKTVEPEMTKTELFAELKKELGDDDFIIDCGKERLKKATKAGTYSAYVSAITAANSDNI